MITVHGIPLLFALAFYGWVIYLVWDMSEKGYVGEDVKMLLAGLVPTVFVYMVVWGVISFPYHKLQLVWL